MLDAAKPHVLRILGPNCIGMLVPHLEPECQLPAHIGALPGELAFVTQSGALMTAMLDWARSRRIGFRTSFLAGRACRRRFRRHARLSPGSDAKTRAILLYIEVDHRGAAQVHVGGAARAQQTGDRREVGPLGAGASGGGLAHRRLAGSDIVSTPPSRAPACCAWTPCSSSSRRRDAGALSRDNRGEAGHPHQRRRRWRDGGRLRGTRRGARRGCRRHASRRLDAQMPPTGRAATRSTSSATRRPSVTFRALEAINADPGPAPCCSCMRPPPSCRAPTSRARWCRWPARARRACSAAGWAAIRWRRRGASSARPASPASRRPRRRCAPSRCW